MAELQTLSKALDILIILGRSESTLSVEDIAKSLDAPESTTYRLLQTLEKKGFIERQSRSNIRLGYNILNLARDTYEKLDKQLTIIATPIMAEITDSIGETSMISIRSGIYSTCLKSIPSKERIRFVADEKRLLPLYLGASGKSILAFEDKKIIELALEGVDAGPTRDALNTELKRIQKQNYATSKSEYDIGAFGLSVPIFNSFHQIYASLALVGPESRFNEKNTKEIVPILQDASRKITEQLL